jgi:hypothetical protein
MTQNPNALCATAMAAHLDMSRANLDKFVSDGVVTRERDGRFNPDGKQKVAAGRFDGHSRSG